MALIKNTQADRIVKQSIVLDLGDLNRQAEQLLASAHAEAQHILEHSRADAQQLLEAAAQRGHAEGKQQGLTEGREQGRSEGREQAIEQFKTQIDQLICSWTEALQRWESDRDAMLLAAGEDVLEFALAMGAKVTHRNIEVDPTIVAEQLAEALSLLAGPTAATVSINPDDRPVVESVLGELLEKFSQCTHIDVRDEAAVSRGGCVIATGNGRVDATIERQIERIVDTLLPPTPDAQPQPADTP